MDAFGHLSMYFGFVLCMFDVFGLGSFWLRCDRKPVFGLLTENCFWSLSVYIYVSGCQEGTTVVILLVSVPELYQTVSSV